MTLATLDDVAVFDDEGRIEGLQFDSRERSIQEWRDRKEDEEYAALFERLYQRNHARKARSTEDGRRRAIENLQRWRDRNREALRARENERNRQRYEADPVVNQCQSCGHAWTVPYDHLGPKKAKFCSKKCRNHHHAVIRSKRKNRGLRKMDLRPGILRYLSGHPDAIAEDIAASIVANANSVRVVLQRMTDEAVLTRIRIVRTYHYSIAETNP